MSAQKPLIPEPPDKVLIFSDRLSRDLHPLGFRRAVDNLVKISRQAFYFLQQLEPDQPLPPRPEIRGLKLELGAALTRFLRPLP